jgi:hypothetical protein
MLKLASALIRHHSPTRVVVAVFEMIIASGAFYRKYHFAERTGDLCRVLLAKSQMLLETPIFTEILAAVQAARVTP